MAKNNILQLEREIEYLLKIHPCSFNTNQERINQQKKLDELAEEYKKSTGEYYVAKKYRLVQDLNL